MSYKSSLSSFVSISPSSEKDVQRYVAKFVEKENLPNKIIRDDIFEILGKRAKVFFYPLGKNDVYGFKVSKIIRDIETNFVLINTEKPIVDQVFAAAHELGHLLNVKEPITTKSDSIEEEEAIMNKFAALLLMPSDLFLEASLNYINKAKKDNEDKKNKNNGKAFPADEIYRLIVYLMDFFVVPCKAVIIRFKELKLIKWKDADYLLDSIEQNKELLNPFFEEGGYYKLYKETGQISFGDFYDTVKLAKAEGKISESAFNNLKEKMGFRDIKEEKDSYTIKMNLDDRLDSV